MNLRTFLLWTNLNLNLTKQMTQQDSLVRSFIQGDSSLVGLDFQIELSLIYFWDIILFRHNLLGHKLLDFQSTMIIIHDHSTLPFSILFCCTFFRLVATIKQPGLLRLSSNFLSLFKDMLLTVHMTIIWYQSSNLFTNMFLST